MAATPFDTLKLAGRLESVGFPAQQAGDTADALAEALSEFATKADIAELRGEIAALWAEMKAEIAALRAEMKAEIAALRAELKADMEILRRDIVIRLGGIMVVAVGVILPGMRFLVVVH